MNLLEIIEIRDKLKNELATVEKFLEIAKAHGSNGTSASHSVINFTSAELAAQKPPVESPSRQQKPAEMQYGAITDLVAETIKMCPEKFSARDVAVVLVKIDNEPLSQGQIASSLKRLERRGTIHIHRNGKGRKPTVYKKIQEAE